MTYDTGTNTGVDALTSTGPQPGWVTLNAARERSFTGEIVFAVDPEVRVYFDNGVAYYAERATDGSLGQRLLDAMLVNPSQLERGTVRVGDVEHLGRLFDRDPSVDRDTVLVVTEAATEEIVAELAHKTVPHVEVAAYRHHPSGVHRWFVAPSDSSGPSRPISEVAQLDSTVVDELPGLPVADADDVTDELRIEWYEPIVGFSAEDEDAAIEQLDESMLAAILNEGLGIDEPVMDADDLFGGAEPQARDAGDALDDDGDATGAVDDAVADTDVADEVADGAVVVSDDAAAEDLAGDIAEVAAIEVADDAETDAAFADIDDLYVEDELYGDRPEFVETSPEYVDTEPADESGAPVRAEETAPDFGDHVPVEPLDDLLAADQPVADAAMAHAPVDETADDQAESAFGEFRIMWPDGTAEPATADYRSESTDAHADPVPAEATTWTTPVADEIEPAEEPPAGADQPAEADAAEDAGGAPLFERVSESEIRFEMPFVANDDTAEDDDTVPEDVAAAVLRAISAIESAAVNSPSLPSLLSPSAPESTETAASEPETAASEPAAPAGPATFGGFAPPTPDMAAEFVYARQAEAAAAAVTHAQVEIEHTAVDIELEVHAPPAPAEPASTGEAPHVDEPHVAEPPASGVASVVFVDDDESGDDDGDDERASALRRLISSLRRK